MCVVNWSTTAAGTSASLGIYAVAFCFGPTTIIDSIRTSMWHQSVFGSAYAIKITMNNAYVSLFPSSPPEKYLTQNVELVLTP
jgi:hypothetical protein